MEIPKETPRGLIIFATFFSTDIIDRLKSDRISEEHKVDFPSKSFYVGLSCNIGLREILELRMSQISNMARVNGADPKTEHWSSNLSSNDVTKLEASQTFYWK